MFGIIYMNEETRKKVEEVQRRQTQFLENCRRIDKEIEADKRSRR